MLSQTLTIHDVKHIESKPKHQQPGTGAWVKDIVITATDSKGNTVDLVITMFADNENDLRIMKCTQ